MKRKLTSTLLVLALVLSVLAGCGKKEEKKTTEATTVAATEATASVATIADATATTASPVDAANQKIVSLAPSNTKILIDLGLEDKIVGIDTNSAYTASFGDAMPQFDMMNPDAEAIVALEPTLVVTSGMSSYGGNDPFASVKEAGINVVDIATPASFDEIRASIKTIGDATGKSAEADEIIKSFDADIEMIKDSAKEAGEAKTVLFMLSLPTADYPSVYTTGSGTYMDEMISTIGAKNVVADQEGWVSLSEEDAIALNPDVIITNADYQADAVDAIKSAKGWENVTAVKNGDVYLIHGNASNQPNHGITASMVEMGKDIYPDAFSTWGDPFLLEDGELQDNE